MKPAPLHRDAVALCGLLLEVFERDPSYAPLRRRLAEGALRLVDAVVYAVAGWERAEQLALADAELLALRTHLSLARDMSMLDDDAYLVLVEQAALVGRQIGGWRKRLARVD